MRFTYKTLLSLTAVAVFVFAVAGNSPTASAQDWLMTKTDELRGDYGELAKTLQTTTNENTLLEILDQPGTENEILFLKMLACKRIATHGTKAAIPTLVKMLDDPKTAHFARYAMEPIEGEEIDQALWDATKTLKGNLLIGVIDSIAYRRNPKAEPVLADLIVKEDSPGRSDPEVAKSVIAAFGAIAGDEAVKKFSGEMLEPAYEGARKAYGPTIADAAFNCAEVLKTKGRTEDALKIYQTIAKLDDAKDYQKESAVYHEILTLGDKGLDLLAKQIQSDNPKMFSVAMKAVRELPAGSAVTTNIAGQIPNLKNDVEKQSQLILALGDRTDADSKKVLLPIFATFLKLDSADYAIIKVAAIKALKNIGDLSVVDSLVASAGSSDAEVAEAAKTTLGAIPGNEVDDAILSLLSQNDVKVKVSAIELVDQRRIVKAVPILKTLAKSDNEDIRKAALKSLAEVVTISDLSTLIDVLADAKSPEEIEANQWALKAATSRMPQEDVAAKVVELIGKASDAEKPNMMEVLMQIGGNNAVNAVTDFAFNGTARLKDKATELLGKWRDPADAGRVAAACLKLAKESTDGRYKNRGLRGYIRYPRQFNMPEPQRIEMVNEYLKLAQRKEDIVLVFQAFTKYPSSKMLEEVMKLVDNSQVKEEACKAAVEVAEKVQGTSQATANAMKKVIATTTDAETKGAAQRVLDKQ